MPVEKSAINTAGTYAADGIRMNNILPGWIDSLPSTDGRRDSVPMKSCGTSAEIAATVSFLAPTALPISGGKTSASTAA